MASVPYQVHGLTAEQADGNIILTWQASLSATSYNVYISTDGITFNLWQTLPVQTQFLFTLIGSGGYFGQQFWFYVIASNATGNAPPSSTVTSVPTPPSELSLMELRLRAQQTADRVGSEFVTRTEWNAFLRLSMYELYDLLIGSYEDYSATEQVLITTNGSQQNYPLPDGITCYPGGQLGTGNHPSFIFTSLAAGTGSVTSVGDVYLNNGYLWTVEFASTASSTGFGCQGVGIPTPSGTMTFVSGNAASAKVIQYSSINFSLFGQPAPAFYKLAGVDLAVNTSTVNPAWVTLQKFNFIDRNKYIYPNSTSTIYGVYNQAYRIMGQQIQFIPVPAGNQTIRITYAPRLPALLQDSDITTLGYSGWLRYPIVRAAKYALDKEEGSDTSKLDAELLFLKQRIEQMSQNRDQGAPDTISETRTDGVYGGNGFGNGGGNAGW